MDDKETDSLPMDAEPIVDQPVLETPPSIPEPSGPERDEHGKFKAKDKGEDNGAPPAQESENVPVKALQEERRKRQELEQQFKELQQQMQQPPAPAPDIFENTEGWQQHFGNQVAQNAAQFAAQNARLDTSEMLAATAHDDFEEMKAEFLEMAQQNPTLAEQAKADRHPWEKAYQIAKNARTMKEMGATSIEELRAGIRAELEAEMKGQAPRFPTSTALDGSVAGRGGPVWSGQTPDKQILPMG
jgi:hypothetical protein